MISIDCGDAVLQAELIGDPALPVLAFANSLGTDFRIWDGVAAYFAGRHRLLLYDKRGHGLSDDGETPTTIDRHVDDVLEILDQLEIERLALVGLSIGGMIGQRLAVRAPGRLTALVLCDTAVKIGTAESWNSRMKAVEESGLEGIADVVMERWFTPAYHEDEPLALRGWRNMLARQSEQGYADSCAAIRDADLTADAGRITVPTLVVVGDQDVSTPPDLVRATAQLIPGSRFEIIADSGHLPCIEQPDALADLIAKHLERAGHG